MIRFALRHFTAILVIVAIAAWALVYLPNTPSWAVWRMKQAIDARDGQGASRFVDFESVVKHAGYEMVQQKGGDNPIGTMVGKAAVDLFSKPMAQMAQAWAVKEVNDGDPDVQMPNAAVAASLVVLHRSGDTAHTDFKDRKGQEWEIHLGRTDEAGWRVTEIKNVGQLLEKLKNDESKNLDTP